MISATSLLDEMEKQASSEELEKVKCIRRYFDAEGIIVDYDKLPSKYKQRQV